MAWIVNNRTITSTYLAFSLAANLNGKVSLSYEGIGILLKSNYLMTEKQVGFYYPNNLNIGWLKQELETCYHDVVQGTVFISNLKEYHTLRFIEEWTNSIAMREQRIEEAEEFADWVKFTEGGVL